MHSASNEERAKVRCPVCGVPWPEHDTDVVCERYRTAGTQDLLNAAGNLGDGMRARQFEELATLAREKGALIVALAEADVRCERVSEYARKLEAERDEYARVALVGLSGLVATPEKGYVADGGPGQFADDLRRLRGHHEDLIAGLAEAEDVRDELRAEIRRMKGFDAKAADTGPTWTEFPKADKGPLWLCDDPTHFHATHSEALECLKGATP